MPKNNTIQKKKYGIADGPVLIKKAGSITDELLAAVRLLPSVNKEGDSECPFAEELYAKKEKLQQEAQSFLKELDEFARWATDELACYQDNLTVILAGKEVLSNNSAINRFTAAEVKLAALAKKLANIRDQVRKAFRNLQEAIKQAAQKLFPGRIPREIPRFSHKGDITSSHNTGLTQKGHDPDDEFNQILKLDMEKRFGNRKHRLEL